MMMTRKLSYSVLLCSFLLVQCLGLGGGTLRVETAQKVFSEGGPEGWRDMVRLLQSGGPQAGKAALALGKSGRPEATALLVREMLNRGPAEREALEGLAMLGDPRAVPALIRIVRDNRPTAPRAVQILGDMRDARALAALHAVVDAALPYRLDALEALGKIGDERSLATLLSWINESERDTPEDVMFRVLEREPGDAEWSHTRTYHIAGPVSSIPPRVDIPSYQIAPDGVITFDYILYDDEYDSLRIEPEYSLDGGRTWSPASVIGQTVNILSTHYQGVLQWQTSLDAVTTRPDVSLIFRLTPADDPDPVPNGVPQMVPISLMAHPLAIQDIPVEVSGDINFGFYFPLGTSRQLDNFVFQYSLNEGRIWLPATVTQPERFDRLPPDSVLAIWESAADLPGYDATNVQFRVSTSVGQRLGRWDATAPFHLDNNDPPSVRIVGVNETDLVELHYRITDAERDPVDLGVEFSKDGGISWERATVSGELRHITEPDYEGNIRWYANFDIPEFRTFPVRIRIVASDRDAGPVFDTKDFFLKPSLFTQRSRGVAEKDLRLSYHTTTPTATAVQSEYSTDGGRTWSVATVTKVGDRQTDLGTERSINWAVESDVPLQIQKVEQFFTALNNIQDPRALPDLVRMSLARYDRNPNARLRAIQAIRILQPRPPWVIEGLMATLLHTDREVNRAAARLLRPITDQAQVASALQGYDRYWTHQTRAEEQLLASVTETEYYGNAVTALRKHRASEGELISFFESRGYPRAKAEQMVQQLNMFKFERQLRGRRDRGEITPPEYERLLAEEIRREYESEP